MGLLICCPVTVRTNLFQKGLKRKIIVLAWQSSYLFSEFFTLFYMTKCKAKDVHISWQLQKLRKSPSTLSPAWYSLIIYIAASSTEIKRALFWGRRDFSHLRARVHILKSAYTGCHFTGAFIPENHLPCWWLPFTTLVGKKPWYSSHYISLDWMVEIMPLGNSRIVTFRE